MTDTTRAITGVEVRRQRYSARQPVWLSIMARVYDPFLRIGEIAGMRAHRRQLLRTARGRVLEVGAGTGLNVACYPAGLASLTLAEPDPGMRRRLARRVRRRYPNAHIVCASAEQLPFDDASVDTVVATLVLCTVTDPQRVLSEIARVLTPDGELLFIEHVLADNRLLAWCQRLLQRPWRLFAGGCVCTRRTEELLRSCGFTVDAAPACWRGMPAIVAPLVIGRATTAPVVTDSAAL